MNLGELLRVASLVFVAVSFVVFGDTAGKLLVAEGVAPIFVGWSRFLIGALLLLPFSGLKWKELRFLLERLVFIRACVISCGICCILVALRTEPIADVFGAFFIGPAVSYVLAVAFLGEKPSAVRSVLLILGFVGVLFVVKPGFGASFGIMFALAAGVCYGVYLAMTRMVAGSYRPRFLLISQLLIGSVILAPLGLGAGFPEPDVSIVVLLVVSALGSAIGNYLLVIVNRTAEASLIAPFIYTQLITATAVSVVIFKEWPDIYSLGGLALIALSGFGTLLTHQWSSRDRPTGNRA